ncbi:MAG: hypothetical protein ACMUJM_25625 [bacterium]
MADSRKAEDWKKHWKCLEQNGYYAIYLASDEGKGICTAKEEALSDIIRKPDTYHAIAHQLGVWVNSLEAAAYKAIREEDEYWNKLDSARTDPVIEKRIDSYEKAKKSASEKIHKYDDFHFLYHCLIEQLKVFDNNGNIRTREEAQAHIETALELIKTLEITKITKAVMKIQGTMPDLLNYFDIAKSIIADLQGLPIDSDALRALCLAWQWRKQAIKAKKAKVRNYCLREEQFFLQLAECYLENDYSSIKDQVYTRLDQIVQSSAMVECINSIIRPYLNNSRNHVTQQMLNLIMFYHNHRRYIDGKRKGKTPFEILTGKEQEKDWLELILDIVEQKDPSSFSNSR